MFDELTLKSVEVIRKNKSLLKNLIADSRHKKNSKILNCPMKNLTFEEIDTLHDICFDVLINDSPVVYEVTGESSIGDVPIRIQGIPQVYIVRGNEFDDEGVFDSYDQAYTFLWDEYSVYLENCTQEPEKQCEEMTEDLEDDDELERVEIEWKKSKTQQFSAAEELRQKTQSLLAKGIKRFNNARLSDDKFDFEKFYHFLPILLKNEDYRTCFLDLCKNDASIVLRTIEERREKDIVAVETISKIALEAFFEIVECEVFCWWEGITDKPGEQVGIRELSNIYVVNSGGLPTEGPFESFEETINRCGYFQTKVQEAKISAITLPDSRLFEPNRKLFEFAKKILDWDVLSRVSLNKKWYSFSEGRFRAEKVNEEKSFYRPVYHNTGIGSLMKMKEYERRFGQKVPDWVRYQHPTNILILIREALDRNEPWADQFNIGDVNLQLKELYIGQYFDRHQKAKNTDGRIPCPLCESQTDCEHLLLWIDKGFMRKPLGGVLKNQVEKFIAHRLEEIENNPNLDGQNEAEQLLKQISPYSDAAVEFDLEGPTGTKVTHIKYYGFYKKVLAMG